MRKWEKVYEYYKSPEALIKYNQLGEKVNTKKAKREEVDEYNKMSKIIDNLAKVKNIKEYMEKLDKNLEILKEEFYLRQDEEKGNRQIKILENASAKLDIEVQKQQAECEQIRAEQKQIQNDINALMLSNVDGKNNDRISALRDKKNKLEKDYEKTLLSIQAKEDKIRENKAKKEDIREDWKTKVGKPELAKYTKNELRKECFETAGLISKCHVVAGHLMEGLSRESIEMKLAKDWKDRKFTSKDPLPLTRKERELREEKKEEKPENPKVILDNNVLMDELKKLNPDVKMKMGNSGMDMVLDGDVSKLKLPEGFYYNDKNGITNKHNTGGLYTYLNVKEGKIEDEVGGLAEIDEFAKAYPRLSKFLPKFIKNSNFAKKRAHMKLERMGYFDKTEDEQSAKKSENSELDLAKIKAGLEGKADEFVDKDTTTDRDKFVKSLKNANILDVADKGIDSIEGDRRAEKLAKAKQDAIDRQNAKFAAQGEADYSKKSGDER